MQTKAKVNELPVYLTYGQLNAEKNPAPLVYKTKLKTYSDGTSTLFYYQNSRVKTNNSSNISNNSDNDVDLTDEELDEIKKHRLFKIKNKMKDYARNNDFSYFFTLTFDPEKYGTDNVIRYEHMKKWLHKERAKARYHGKEFRYVFVPEFHKGNGKNFKTIHWHGIVGGYCPDLVDSGKKHRNIKVFNCKTWEFGFSTVTKVKSKRKISNYMTKYITKDLLDSPVRKGKKKYWASKNLKTPQKKYLNTKIDVGLTPDFSNDVVEIYELDEKETKKIKDKIKIFKDMSEANF